MGPVGDSLAVDEDVKKTTNQPTKQKHNQNVYQTINMLGSRACL